MRYVGFGPEEDEWVNVRKSIRERSIALENSECNKVRVGDPVLCFQVSLSSILVNLFSCCSRKRDELEKQITSWTSATDRVCKNETINGRKYRYSLSWPLRG